MADIHLRPEGDERFIYIAHRHWMALLIRAIVPVIVFLLAFGALLIRALDRTPDFLGRQPPLFDPINIFLMVSIVITVAIVIYVYLDWRNDHIIVSNKRVVHEDRTLWLSYRYDIIPLDQIQNVNVRTDNILQYVLRYGWVEVQAAGPTEPIVFDRANCPIEIQREILNEVQREKRNMEQKRLLATVERRINPNAPPPPPLKVPIENKVSQPTAFHLLFPIEPVVQGGTITWHRHWIVLLKLLVGPLIALILWVALLWALPRFQLLDPTPTVIVLFVSFVFVLLYFFWQYENWRNDIYILEPTKVIDIQQLPLGLYENRREATLGVIQNVNAVSPNLLARLLGYGDVLIETAGLAGNFTFDHVPDPDQVQRIVFEYRERFRWEQREREWNNTLNIVELYYRAGNNGNP